MERYLACSGKEPVKEGPNRLWGALESMHHEMTGVWQVDSVIVVEADITYTRNDGLVVVLPAATVLCMQGERVKDIRINYELLLQVSFLGAVADVSGNLLCRFTNDGRIAILL